MPRGRLPIRNLFDPDLGPPDPAGDAAAVQVGGASESEQAETEGSGSGAEGSPEPDPRDLELARLREDNERQSRLLEAALSRPAESRAAPAPPAAPPIDEPWPDPVTQSREYTQRIRTEGQQIVASVDQKLRQREQREAAERMVRDFIDEHPQFKGLGFDRIRNEFLVASDYAAELPRDPIGLKRRVADNLEGLRKALGGGSAPGAAPPPASRVAGTSGGSRQPRVAPKQTEKAPLSMVDEIDQWQERVGL